MNLGANKIKRLLFIGNSLSNCSAGIVYFSYRFPNTLYSSVASLNKGYSFFAYAISGKQGQQIISEWSIIMTQQPIGAGDVVIVWEGINDMGAGGLNGTQAYNNLVTICSNIRATGAKAVLLNVIPANLTGTYPNWNTDRNTCNSLIATNQTTICDAYVDLTANAAFSSATAFNDATYYHTDKIHLNNVGYDLLSSIVYPIIQPIL